MREVLTSTKQFLLFCSVIGLFLSCSFHVEVDVPPPIISGDTVIIQSLCETTAVDMETGKVKWEIKTLPPKQNFCKE